MMSEYGLRQAGASGFPQQGVEWCSNTGNYANYNAPYPTAQPSQAYPTSSFEDEPPLLEELGIDLSAIVKKVRAILLFRLSSPTLENLDLGGALIFVLILGGLHLLLGKLHVGIILGWSVTQSILMWVILNQLAGSCSAEFRQLDLYGCCCVVGYGALPLIVHSVIALFIPKGAVSIILACLCTLWAGLTACRVFVRRCPALDEQKPIVLVPCTLLYSSLALLAVY